MPTTAEQRAVARVVLLPVTGAFAFAHKTAPRKVEAFLEKVVEGLGLERGEPAHTLRSFLLAPRALGRHTGQDRTTVSRKVLQAIYADVKGEPYAKAQTGTKGLEFFRRAYDAKSTERLVGLWTHPVIEESH